MSRVRVPFMDLSVLHAPIKGELLAALETVIDGSDFILGPSVASFEESFAAFVGRRHCIAVSSGTAALHLALLSLGIGPRDEVITTPLTFIATAWAISYCGARPVFADVDPATGTLDPVDVPRRVSPRTRAVLSVDLHGHPSALPDLVDYTSSQGIALVDDACQAHGAQLLGQPVGSFGDLACFSFYPGKNLGALGEGGAIVTDNPRLASRLRELRDHAQSARNCHTELGFNYRMDGFQGAVLRVKLAHLDAWNSRRRSMAERYISQLSSLDDIIALPSISPDVTPNWHHFVVLTPRRDAVRQRLFEVGVETGVHYPVPVHLQPAYSHLGYAPGAFPNAEHRANSCISLPLSPEMSLAQQDYVMEALECAVREVL